MKSETEVEYWGTRVPLVCATRVGCAGSKGHISHWDLVNISSRILCCAKTSRWRGLSCQEVDEGSSSALSGIAGPKDGADLMFSLVLGSMYFENERTYRFACLQRGLIDLPSTKLDDHEGLPNLL